MAKSKDTDVKEAQEAKEAQANEENEEAVVMKVEETALTKIVSGLPPEVAEKVTALLASMNPNKPGFEEMGGARWSPPVVKVHQPTSGDMPGASKQGDLYTDTGDLLPRPLEIIPVYMHYSHVRFEPGNNNPTCRSEDGKRSIYGDICKDCRDLPFRDGNKTTCNKSMEVYAFDKNCTKILRLQFSKTSYKAGSKLYRQASSSPVPWARIYALDTEKKTRQNETGVYYVLTVTPTGEDTNQQFFPLIEHVYSVVSEVRKQVLSRIEDRSSVGQQVADNLLTDFGGVVDGNDKKGGGQPDFSDM